MTLPLIPDRCPIIAEFCRGAQIPQVNTPMTNGAEATTRTGDLVQVAGEAVRPNIQQGDLLALATMAYTLANHEVRRAVIAGGDGEGLSVAALLAGLACRLAGKQEEAEAAVRRLSSKEA